MCTHPWPKLRVGLAVSWHTRRCVVAFPWSYRSLCPAVLWPCRKSVAARTRALARRVAALCHDTKPCHRPLMVTIQNLYRDPSPCRACHSPQRRFVAHYCAISQPWRAVSQPKVAPLNHDTIFFFFFVSLPRGRPAHDTNFVSQHPHLVRLRVVS